MSDNTNVPWRVGRSYGIHVYADDVSVATFHTSMDAAAAVKAHNDALTADPEDVALIHKIREQAQETADLKAALDQRLRQASDLIDENDKFYIKASLETAALTKERDLAIAQRDAANDAANNATGPDKFALQEAVRMMWTALGIEP